MPDSLLYLYIPAYGALLYSYRSRGKWKGLKAFLYLAAPIMLALWISHASLTVNLSVILLALFAAAQVKGWLQADGTPRHKNNYTAAGNGSADKSMSSRFPRVWMKTPAVILCAAAVCLIVFNNLFKPYQIKRIAVWLDRKALGKSYVVEVVRSILNGSRLIGGKQRGGFGWAAAKSVHRLHAYKRDWIFWHTGSCGTCSADFDVWHSAAADFDLPV